MSLMLKYASCVVLATRDRFSVFLARVILTVILTLTLAGIDIRNSCHMTQLIWTVIRQMCQQNSAIDMTGKPLRVQSPLMQSSLTSSLRDPTAAYKALCFRRNGSQLKCGLQNESWAAKFDLLHLRQYRDSDVTDVVR